MGFLQAVITGIIQGLTEFLPVSSSGHIILTSAVYKHFTGKVISGTSHEEILFDILLHVGTLIAVLIYFRKDIAKILSISFKAIKDKDLRSTYEAKIPWYIILGTFATICLAAPLKKHAEAIADRPDLVGITLLVTGTILFSTEYISSRIPKKTNMVTWKKSVLMGLGQACAAAAHGLSRSGTTIAVGLASGLERETAARYSFLLSIPVILLAAVAEMADIGSLSTLSTFNWPAMLTGTLLAGVIGYFCIKYFLRFISNQKLNIFAYYCWIVGITTIILCKFF